MPTPTEYRVVAAALLVLAAAVVIALAKAGGLL